MKNDKMKYYNMIDKHNLTYKSLGLYVVIFRILGVFTILMSLLFMLVSFIFGLVILMFGCFCFILANTYKTARTLCFNPNGERISPYATSDIPVPIEPKQEPIHNTENYTNNSDKPIDSNIDKESTDTNIQEKQIEFHPFDDEFLGCIKQYEYYHVSYFVPDNMESTKLLINDVITLKQEPDNEYDHNAIALYKNDDKIGYLYKSKLQDMSNDYLKRDDKYIVIAKADSENSISLFFYKHITLLNNYSEKIFKLTGLSKKDEYGYKRMDNLLCVDRWDSVSLDYDFETEKYIVSTTYGEIGELSKSTSQKIDDSDLFNKDYYAFITKLTHDDGNISSCEIGIFSEI